MIRPWFHRRRFDCAFLSRFLLLLQGIFFHERIFLLHPASVDTAQRDSYDLLRSSSGYLCNTTRITCSKSLRMWLRQCGTDEVPYELNVAVVQGTIGIDIGAEIRARESAAWLGLANIA